LLGLRATDRAPAPMVDIHECPVVLVPEPDHAAAATTTNPDPSSISSDAWVPFEDAALAVVGRIQPSVPSEGRRAAVVQYVQRLIRCTVGCEVKNPATPLVLFPEPRFSNPYACPSLPFA
jgi:hypothetical protein